MVKGHAQGLRITFQRPRSKSGNEASSGLERLVDARRQVVAGTDDGTEIPHVQLRNPQIPFPPDYIHGIERIAHFRPLTLSLDADLPCLESCFHRLYCLQL